MRGRSEEWEWDCAHEAMDDGVPMEWMNVQSKDSTQCPKDSPLMPSPRQSIMPHGSNENVSSKNGEPEMHAMI